MKMVMVVFCLIACLKVGARGESAASNLKPFFGGAGVRTAGGPRIGTAGGPGIVREPPVHSPRARG